jgi:CheY-like chemotaxis protein
MSWNVLIAEDSENDLFLLLRALSSSDKLTVVHSVTSGDEAVRYLAGQGIYADRTAFPLPHLLITDLKMPGFDGLDLLEWLKDHPFPNLVVMMLTASTRESDIEATEKLRADAYFTKPNSREEMMNLILTIESLMAACPKALLSQSPPYNARQAL